MILYLLKNLPGNGAFWYIFLNFAGTEYFPQFSFVKRTLKLLTNKYIITAVLFLLLMLFFDQNDWFTQNAKETELSQTQEKIDHLNGEVARMEKELKELNGSNGKLEQYAREKYHEKRDGEDVYLIIADSVKPQQKK